MRYAELCCKIVDVFTYFLSKKILFQSLFKVASDSKVRRVFSEHRAGNPNQWNWTVACVPKLKDPTKEKLQREAEKRKIQKERRKMRLRAKREEEKIEKELQVTRNVFVMYFE